MDVHGQHGDGNNNGRNSGHDARLLASDQARQVGGTSSSSLSSSSTTLTYQPTPSTCDVM
jgi:hypothetical protein